MSTYVRHLFTTEGSLGLKDTKVHTILYFVIDTSILQSLSPHPLVPLVGLFKFLSVKQRTPFPHE